MKRIVCLALVALAACSASDEERRTAGFYDWLGMRQIYYNRAMDGGNVDALNNLTRELTHNAERNADLLLAGVDHVDNDRRLEAIFGLAFVRTVEARDLLLVLLGDENPLIRTQAAASLGLQARESTPVEPLIVLLKDPDERVRRGALFGLRGVLRKGKDRGGALNAAVACLEDQVPSVRSEALSVLMRLALPSTVDLLVEKGLKDKFEFARYNAAIALREIGPEAYTAVPALIEALRDDVHAVVVAARSALRRITGADLDRSYPRWRDWYEEERKLYYYICLEHPESDQDHPGICQKCGKELQRELRDKPLAQEDTEFVGEYICPNHTHIRATRSLICDKCGERLIHERELKKKEAAEEGPADDEPEKKQNP
ncbi:MAG: HEAT repeat domain-containing protein [Planctomycetota bacterium]|jgi:HEAT repeat protein